MHDSFTPLGGIIPMINMMLGDIMFGGVGAGLYGIVVFIILTVFIAGLMVGRTPEYLGKKIEAYDVKMAMLAVLIFSMLILVFTAVGSVRRPGKRHYEPRAARPVADPVRVHVRSGEQRLGVCGAECEYGLVQRDAWVRHVVRKIFHGLTRAAIAGSLRKRKSYRNRRTFPVTTPLLATLLVSVILIVEHHLFSRR